jgi:hypothetical protein
MLRFRTKSEISYAEDETARISVRGTVFSGGMRLTRTKAVLRHQNM